MKIIEGLKKIKDLAKKAEDLRGKVSQYCADLDCESPVYPDQKRQISEWLQSHSDVIKEILALRYRIQKTNIATQVTMQLNDRSVTKSIAEWVHRRRDLAELERTMWNRLSDRGLKDMSTYKLTPQSPENIVKRRLYFDPKERDEKVELYRSEPGIIDATLETINAVTDLVE